MPLEEYIKKRDFSKTPEPDAVVKQGGGALKFVLQRHQARRLHYDLRLEMDGLLKSWAVPRGPSMNPKDKRLAVHTEDHPMDYLRFEGTIPKGNYGAGEMAIWDGGTYKGAEGYPGDLREQYQRGDLKIEFFGEKIQGVFALVRTKRGEKNDQWLLIKKKDGFATDLEYDAEDFAAQQTNLVETSALDVSQMVKPMLATKTDGVFNDPGWIYELKWDGYRLLTNIHGGEVQMYSRNGVSYNVKFAALCQQMQGIPHDVILDGEVVIVNPEGIPEFQKLQNYQKDTEGELRYYVFDLLFLNGHDITALPLVERKSFIPEVIKDIPLVFFCDHLDAMGATFYEQAISAGMEGIVAKKADSAYIPGTRTANWLKIKSVERQEVLICGYTVSDSQAFGSLILGLYQGGQLAYVGNCGSGFNEALQKELLLRFQSYERKTSPFHKKINLKGRKANWLEPELVAEVKFSDWTSAGLMRHPVFIGMREDKAPEEIQPEMLEKAPGRKTGYSNEGETIEVDGLSVPITHLDKVYWPESNITKYQLIDYYLSIAETILPFLKDRPQNLHRHPEGIHKEGFYQKDTSGIFPHWIETVDVYSKSNDRTIQYLLCQQEATLLYMANLGCIEINPWNSRKGFLDYPDYGVIDLDPSDQNSFQEVVEVAQVAKSIIDSVQIPAFCKTSGSSGLHIYIPLSAQYTHDESRDFIKLLCYLIHEQLPALTSMERQVNKRKKKIYLDFLQNRKGQTLAAPYCVRPKPGATVSAPLKWEEVRSGLDMREFNIFTMKDRVEKEPDLFLDVLGPGIDIAAILERLSE